ncbi:MAG TPA: cobalt ECF transporter T component CbiQ, partial [Methanomicrobiales archaeon]|nr:cobalt ECF transporter T component CbiQ [Methanomicrobiales archaeon]
MYEELLEDIAQRNGLREVNTSLKLAAALGAILLCLASTGYVAPLAIAALLSLAILLLARVDART